MIAVWLEIAFKKISMGSPVLSPRVGVAGFRRTPSTPPTMPGPDRGPIKAEKGTVNIPSGRCGGTPDRHLSSQHRNYRRVFFNLFNSFFPSAITVASEQILNLLEILGLKVNPNLQKIYAIKQSGLLLVFFL